MSSHRFVTFASPRDRVFFELLKELRHMRLVDLVTLRAQAQALNQRRAIQEADLVNHYLCPEDESHAE